MTSATDWDAWHRRYDDPDSPLSQRLRIIQGHIADWLTAGSQPGPRRVVSACSGDGRDLLGVLAGRPEANQVSATLLEFDARNVQRAREFAATAGLANVTVRQVDAAETDAYIGAVPADLVLLCGIFGNISDAEVQQLIRAAPQFCRPGATVIWTRHTGMPDLTPRIRSWFREAGFAERAFAAPAGTVLSVGCAEYRGEPTPLVPGQRLFTFFR